MSLFVRSNVTSTPKRATAHRAMLAVGIVALALGGIAPAAAGGSSGRYIPKPDIRDHRTKPVVRDHRGGTVTETRDHRGDGNGGVTVGAGKRRPHGVPCLGNLC